MTRKQESVLAWVIILILLLIIFSCRTRERVVTETTHTHDTLIVHKTDTLLEIKVKEVRDTVRQTESHYYTLNNVGDTVKEIHHYYDIMRTFVVDSTHRYQAKVDSLQKLVDHLRDTSKVVKKGVTIPWWAWIVSPLILIAGGGFLVRKILNKKWHIT